jgi:hypothetical protein
VPYGHLRESLAADDDDEPSEHGEYAGDDVDDETEEHVDEQDGDTPFDDADDETAEYNDAT